MLYHFEMYKRDELEKRDIFLASEGLIDGIMVSRPSEKMVEGVEDEILLDIPSSFVPWILGKIADFMTHNDDTVQTVQLHLPGKMVGSYKNRIEAVKKAESKSE